jgi:hypothetical protein
MRHARHLARLGTTVVAPAIATIGVLMAIAQERRGAAWALSGLVAAIGFTILLLGRRK